MFYLNYFRFMVQQRVQVFIEIVAYVGTTPFCNNNMAFLFTMPDWIL